MLCTWGQQAPGWVLPGASLDINFVTGTVYCPGGGSISDIITGTRASAATSLLPSSASGASYTSFGPGVFPLAPGTGALLYQAATNLLLNSTAPVTQTTASLGTGSYTLWVNGSGSALASAGTATITGASSATNGSPNTFTVTVAGTVTITKTGSLNAFQLEAGTFGTSLIVTTGSTATRAADVWNLTGAAATAALNAKAMFAQTNLVNFNGGSVNRFLGFSGGSTILVSSTSSINISDGTNSGTVTIGGAGVISGLTKSAFGFDNASMTGIANGGTKATQSTSIFATNQTGTVTIGNIAAGTRALNGAIQRLVFGPVKGQFDGITV